MILPSTRISTASRIESFLASRPRTEEEELQSVLLPERVHLGQQLRDLLFLGEPHQRFLQFAFSRTLISSSSLGRLRR